MKMAMLWEWQVFLQTWVSYPLQSCSKCLHLWRVHGCIPRIQLGMKFSPIIFQNLIYMEKISRKCNTETGLIVEEVARGSVAEKLDMRNGDIILPVNGECIATTIELELMLLRICEDNLVRGNGPGSNVDIPENDRLYLELLHELGFLLDSITR
ncbi:uncharacterized protein LOC119361285 [Triticum dicoccoides]|uniref:uncharacterized protein LOC119361285 n=1 Tax=Triticum dicoccoides TaxID=85692 RepID=UPI001890A9F9|nr:uncharacterized protein LOC119361285 [Triticum dicoccoides]